ncbi:ParB/RepB/Spo0J family partition protein [Corynebacterium sp. A21]|uniref:ParB/RepB/Spo0J family partition protein n=1 Tax=Corynebacterium sp. A21 TaxID=3457318 RepID=UPI003FD11275
MSQETRKGGLGRGLAALIPSAASSAPRLGESAADIVLGGTRGAKGERDRREAEEVKKSRIAKAFQDAPAATEVEDETSSSSPATPFKAPEGAPSGLPMTGNPREVNPLIVKAAAADSPVPDPPAAPEPVVPQTVAEIGASYREIPLDDITPNPKQPRHVFEEEPLDELVHSIREFGLMQPIVVRPKATGGFELIMGERRWRASREAGLDVIPAIVRETEDGSMLRDALLENIHRVQLNPLEEASAYQQLLEEFDVTQAELAQRLGRSRPVITNMIRLLALPVSVQRKVAAGVLSAGHARALLGIKDGDGAREQLADRIIAEGMSVRATEEAVTLLNRGDDLPEKKPKEPAPQPEFLTRAADRLADGLDTQVSVMMGKRKGKIVVEFGDRDDFERIMALIDRER